MAGERAAEARAQALIAIPLDEPVDATHAPGRASVIGDSVSGRLNGVGATANYRASTLRLAEAASNDREVAEACRSFQRPGRDPLSLLMAGLPADLRERLPATPVPPGAADPMASFREATAMFEETSRRAEATLAKHGLDPAELQDALDIDKSWRALEAMLEAVTPPGDRAREAVLGGTPFGENLGYGPARWMDPAAVLALASALAAVAEEAVRAHVAASTPPLPSELLARLPPGLALGATEAQVDVFRRVRDYFAAAAARGDAMLLWLA